MIKQIKPMKNQPLGSSKNIKENSMIKEKPVNKTQVLSTKENLSRLERELEKINGELDPLLLTIPNSLDKDVPFGADETENLEVHKFGDIPNFNFIPKAHYELGENLKMMDFEKAAEISGARFTILKDKLAMLERALGQFMIDMHVEEHGYTEVSVPLLVRDKALFGTAQLPKFSEELFKTDDNRWMISTGEIPLTNLVCNEILPEDKLPLRYTTLSSCFRSEAGAAGRDTRGMLRQHQFSKVEMVAITKIEDGEKELQRMLKCAEKVLEVLNIPYRTMLLCSGDIGFASKKTYDIEAWIPSQNTYREISSCSFCGDFQARRMKARYRSNNGKDLYYVGTLNGSGLAVGRCLIAVMENYQQEDGSIVVPEALRKYMRNIEIIK